jgi:hypothetical protein
MASMATEMITTATLPKLVDHTSKNAKNNRRLTLPPKQEGVYRFRVEGEGGNARQFCWVWGGIHPRVPMGGWGWLFFLNFCFFVVQERSLHDLCAFVHQIKEIFFSSGTLFGSGARKRTVSGEDCPSNSKFTQVKKKNVKLSLHFDDVFLEIIDLKNVKTGDFAAMTSSRQISKISSKGLRSTEENLQSEKQNFTKNAIFRMIFLSEKNRQREIYVKNSSTKTFHPKWSINFEVCGRNHLFGPKTTTKNSVHYLSHFSVLAREKTSVSILVSQFELVCSEIPNFSLRGKQNKSV